MSKFFAFAAAFATTATLLATGAAQATEISWSVGINTPRLSTYVSNAPAPAYYAPQPVVYAPAPVVYAPAPVVYAPSPVVYAPAPAYYPAPLAYAVPAPVYYRPRLAYCAPLPVLLPRGHAGWRGHPYARVAAGYRVIR